MVTADHGAGEGGQAERRTIGVPGGRAVEFLVTGSAEAFPLVLHSATPGGLVVWPQALAQAPPRGLRIIHIARPGYEGSTPRPGRGVADVTADVAAVLDALGCGQFVTAGWSGGGPHALACSALLQGRCLAAATVAGIAPYGVDGLDWLAGMGPDNIEEFGAALAGPEELTRFLEEHAAGLGAVEADQVVAAMGGLLSAADRQALTPEFADYLAASLRTAVSAGVAGWRDDDLAFATDWGFEVSEASRVAVWQGGEDLMVPAAHGRWLAGHIPGALARVRPGEGHLSRVATGFGEVLDDLITIAGL